MIPLVVDKRPFAIEPRTGVMLPDGIFDTSIPKLMVTCFVRNDGADDLAFGFVRLLGGSDLWKISDKRQLNFKKFKAGSSIQFSWLCDFHSIAPGKMDVLLDVGGTPLKNGKLCPGFDGVITSRIFISQTSYSESSKLYCCEVPEGKMFVRPLKSDWTGEFTIKHRDGNGVTKLRGLPVPYSFEATWIPNVGSELELPFSDPWWKVLALVVAIVAAIGAILYAEDGQGSAYIGVGGYDGTTTDVYWCFPDPHDQKDNNLTPAGICSTIANAAIIVAWSDAIDPWQRGRDHSKLASGEHPLTEVVSGTFELPEQITPGTSYNVGVEWNYEAKLSTGRVTTLKVKESLTNTHAIKKWEVKAPSNITIEQPLKVEVMGIRSDDTMLKPDELYGFALFKSPGPDFQTFRLPLLDDGQHFDKVAGDGWFTAGVMIGELLKIGKFEYRGEWSVTLFAQDVNDAIPSMPPKVAATHIGGIPILSPFSLQRSAKSGPICPINKLLKILVK